MAKSSGGIRSRTSIRWGMMLLLAIATSVLRLTKGSSLFRSLILFGDSTVDVGNNNYLATLVKSDFSPYGRDLLPSHMGTGRFSNGLLVGDFIAQYLGLPISPAYLDPEAQGDRLLQGINFGSSASGWIDSTAEIFVRSFTQQVQDFKDYKSKLIELVGLSQAADILGDALYIISTGSNDYVNNYFLTGVEREHYTLPQWQDHITTAADQFLQVIYNEGGRKMVVASVPAIGCLPAAISVYGEGSNKCVTFINNAAVGLNAGMKRTLLNLQRNLPGVQFLFLDIYTNLIKAVQNPSAYGFEETRNACCGTGKIEVAILCNAESPGTCSDASKYLFFDSFHPSQAFYRLVADKAHEQILLTF